MGTALIPGSRRGHDLLGPRGGLMRAESQHGRGVGDRGRRVLELEPESEQTPDAFLDHHRDDDAGDRDPVGRAAGDRRRRQRFLTV